jgi:hypothetical protein
MATSLAAFLLVAGPAAAQQAPASTPITGISSTTSVSAEARVAAIDQTTRTVTLVGADGRTLTHRVSDLVQNLGQVKVGDTVIASYEERLTFVLSRPGARMPQDRAVAAGVRAAPGQMPSGGLLSHDVASFTVIGTNLQANTISLVSANGGEIRTFNVTDPNARRELPKVKPGDYLTVIDRQVVVAAVVRKA